MNDRVCVVRGVLSLALRVSRIFGLTPLRLEPLQNGYKASVSQPHVLFSYTMIIVLYILETVSFINQPPKFLWFQLDLIIIWSILTLAYCKVKSRMRYMILNLNVLEKAKIGIDQNFASDSQDGNKINYSTLGFSVVMQFFMIALDITYLIVLDSTQVSILFSHGVFFTSLLILLVLETVFVLINFEVLAMFQLMCKKLRQLEALIKTGCVADLRAVNDSVRNLSHSYVSGCDVVHRINQRDGMITVLLFSMFGVSIFIVGYTLTTDQYNTSKSLYYIKDMSWIIFIVLKAFAHVQPSHLITREVKDMEMLLSQLMIHSTPVGKPVSIEIDIMFKETLLNRPTFAPLDMFTVDKSLIIVMCSYVTTYLAFLMQFKSQ